ncbi:MAG TPA: hypothetical protein VJ761_03585 [Ktedonobacteraceae bacterium]|nr:hypothetical protein [Ktedonobacteraceae bacterium]
MTNNSILLLFAIVNVVVLALFAGLVLSQYTRRHRVYQLFWSIALTMAFIATLAYVLMVIVEPTSNAGMLFFRLYYILGGALTPAWLGLGSIALVTSPRVTRICLGVLCVLSIVAAGLVAAAGIDLQALRHIAGTPGTGILQPSFGAWTAMIIILNTLGVLAVVGVAVYSGWKMVRRQSNIAGFRASNLLWANVLILVGELLNAAAGSFARFFGLESSFWLIMSLGWVVFFAGVLLTSRRPATARTTTDTRNSLEAKGPIASV